MAVLWPLLELVCNTEGIYIINTWFQGKKQYKIPFNRASAKAFVESKVDRNQIIKDCVAEFKEATEIFLKAIKPFARTVVSTYDTASLRIELKLAFRMNDNP